MNKIFVLLVASCILGSVHAQAPKIYSSADILNNLEKLPVFGSVLYLAAHPDDENTRLLAWLANERHYRTGYLSLTRGDGGQNLIGDEQGIDLGLIRTQELLAARRIDGAEQFFSRAYDFGFSKNPDEALRIWGHDKILSDVVWVIRNFKPDVIITRFPTTGEGGHGHHTASAILAVEAFDAAVDPAKFPEQLVNGVTTWQAKRLMWNTFNFGGTNTTREDQLKIDVGTFNAVLGKSYGEMAAESRSQHKSQGFGVPAQRGESLEYFSTIKGEKPVKDLIDGIDVSNKRDNWNGYEASVKNLLDNYNPTNPSSSVQALSQLFGLVQQQNNSYWKEQKLKELSKLIEAASGIFMDATTTTPYAVKGDSLKIAIVINNRSGVNIKNASIRYGDLVIALPLIEKNKNASTLLSVLIPANAKLTQPYWLEKEMNHGSFNVTNQAMIGKAENDIEGVEFSFDIDDIKLVYNKPVKYKFTDPVKGELYQPLSVVPALSLNIFPGTTVINRAVNTNTIFTKNFRLLAEGNKLPKQNENYTALSSLPAGSKYAVNTVFDVSQKNGSSENEIIFKDQNGVPYNDLREINYDHIPAIKYFKTSKLQLVFTDAKTNGTHIGYIVGAGDKVPPALEQMGYTITLLTEKEITSQNLKNFDAIVTGVRAYNIHNWLSNAYPHLMQYVKDGGVLVSQYNTNNSIGPVKASISPYPFTISRNRVTDENAQVKFLLPAHPVLNFPNKITQKDFEGWVQERSIYNAENIDSNYKRILSMNDPGEAAQDGSLIVADYGKGRFIYTGLVFYRELPAGVPGAYRLFANIVASTKPPVSNASSKSKQVKSAIKPTKISAEKEVQ
ncbi:MAG: PIG-L family deacetylase [Ferruginibacter sp.]